MIANLNIIETIVFMVRVIIGLLALGVTVSPLAGQAIDPTEDEDRAGSGRFSGNPYEAQERQVRQREYETYYENNVGGQLDQNVLLREVFAPRVYDETFDTDLPGTQHKGQWSLRLNPKFGDLLDDPYVRFPVGVKYNFSDYFDAFAEVGTYFPNPFDSGDGSGIYNLRTGVKYSWLRIAETACNLAVGIHADLPTSNPPIEITDGYARYEPYVVVSRQLPNHLDWLTYLNLTYQFVEDTPFRSDPVDPQPKDRVFVRPGVIYYPGGRFRWSFELEYRTNALDFRDAEGTRPLPVGSRPPGIREANWILAFDEVHEVMAYPGVTWFPQKAIRDNLFIPGNWDLGLRLDVPIVEETGEDFGVSLRFRWFYDYRKFIVQDIPELMRANNGR